MFPEYLGKTSDSAKIPHTSCLRPELFVLTVGGEGVMDMAQAGHSTVTAWSHQWCPRIRQWEWKGEYKIFQRNEGKDFTIGNLGNEGEKGNV